MSFANRFLIACTIALLYLGCADERQRVAIEVIAYHHGDTSEIRNYAIDELTQIIYSFLFLDGNAISIGNEQQRNDILNLVSLKKDHPNLKILVALGGWGGCETCSDVFSSAAGRAEFAVSVEKLLSEYDLDGLDLDWEYPAIEGHPGHPFRPEDRENFTALVKVLRETLGEDYDLSFAAGATPKFFETSVEWTEIMPFLDRVNLMTYDFVSGLSPVTGHHTPLHSSESQELSADYAVRYLRELGVEPQKIVIGAAFYARVWEAVDSEDGQSLHKPATFKEFVGYRQFDEYFGESFVASWDESAGAPYSFSASEGLFGTYDDRRSVALKTQYAIDNGLGGIMMWQLGEDKQTGGLLSAIAETASKAADDEAD